MPSFTPKSDKELNDERLLPKGEYDFNIISATNKQFRSGSEGIALSLGVYDSEGNMRLVNDNIVFSERAMFKVSQFSKCVGLYEKYNTGDIDAEDCKGRSGRCKIDIEPEGEFPAKNKVSGYVVPKTKPQSQSADSIAKQQAEEDLDVPF